ncbi:MAG: hypothetical protein ABIS69_08055 [Sediminibacterium sp.]
MKTPAKTVVRNINKPAYILFSLAGICYLIAHDLSGAVIFWGLALVFDPFNTATPFPKRPLYQKTWLFVHVIIQFMLLAWMLLKK